LVEISIQAYVHLKNGRPIRELMGSSVDAIKLLSCATLFSYASRGGSHEELFQNLRHACEEQLKKTDDKSIEFCEASLTSPVMDSSGAAEKAEWGGRAGGGDDDASLDEASPPEEQADEKDGTGNSEGEGSEEEGRMAQVGSSSEEVGGVATGEGEIGTPMREEEACCDHSEESKGV
jgi:hypothetical protein